jgi:hypothetical protein
MMDPVTAIGLVSAVLTFVDFGKKLVDGTVEIYQTGVAGLKENEARMTAATSMHDIAAKLQPPDTPGLSVEDKKFCGLAADCKKLSEDLIKLLGRMKPKKEGSLKQSLWAALMSVMKEGEREGLEKRLDHCRSQFELHLVFYMKYLDFR